jgi:hypothetical protein
VSRTHDRLAEAGAARGSEASAAVASVPEP